MTVVPNGKKVPQRDAFVLLERVDKWKSPIGGDLMQSGFVGGYNDQEFAALCEIGPFQAVCSFARVRNWYATKGLT